MKTTITSSIKKHTLKMYCEKKIKQKDIIISEVAISKDFFKNEIIIGAYIVCKKLELMNIRNCYIKMAWKE